MTKYKYRTSIFDFVRINEYLCDFFYLIYFYILAYLFTYNHSKYKRNKQLKLEERVCTVWANFIDQYYELEMLPARPELLILEGTKIISRKWGKPRLTLRGFTTFWFLRIIQFMWSLCMTVLDWCSINNTVLRTSRGKLFTCEHS